VAKIVGEQQLMNRLHAVGVQGSTGIMKRVAAYTRGQLVRNMPRKTGLTAGSLRPTVLSPTKAEIHGSPVAVWIDIGTGLYGPQHHVITPRAAKALAFHVGTFGRGGSLRLSGSPRSGKAGLGASLVIVRSVKGMKPRPYINRSVTEAAQKVGAEVNSEIITAWNSGA
jgi:hypothetical protein